MKCGLWLPGGSDIVALIAVLLLMMTTALIGFRRARGWESAGDHSLLKVLLLCAFFGVFGAHRFYVGKPLTALLQALTFGGLGIWLLADFFTISVGGFSDKDGYTIR